MNGTFAIFTASYFCCSHSRLLSRPHVLFQLHKRWSQGYETTNLETAPTYIVLREGLSQGEIFFIGLVDANHSNSTGH